MIGSTWTWVPKMSTFSIRKRRYIDNPNPLPGKWLRLCFAWKMLLKVLQQQDSFSSWNQCNEIWESLHQSRKPTIFERSSTKVRESVRFVHHLWKEKTSSEFSLFYFLFTKRITEDESTEIVWKRSVTTRPTLWMLRQSTSTNLHHNEVLLYHWVYMSYSLFCI